MAGGSEEWVKYMAERFVTYIETPRDVRRQIKATRKDTREHWQYRWFGMVPLAIRMWAENILRRRRGNEEK